MPYLVDCLESILQQTYTSWELIAIDDYSTDQSWEILQKYASKHSNIKVFQNNEKGIISALRLAYQNSNGTLITRMDADDKMSSDKIEVLKNNLLKHGEGYLAVGKVAYFSEGDLGNGYQRYAQWLNQLIETGNCFEDIYKECVIPSPAWMISRQDLDSCQAFYPSVYPEDYDLCFRFYEQGIQPIPCDKVVHLWRDHPHRTSRTDSNYADNRFLELKLHYFLQLDYQSDRELIVWGAGKKGKKTAQYLIEQDIPFTWICNNQQKIGKNIYGKQLYATNYLSETPSLPQVLLLVAQPAAQQQIKQQLDAQKLQKQIDYFFFC